MFHFCILLVFCVFARYIQFLQEEEDDSVYCSNWYYFFISVCMYFVRVIKITTNNNNKLGICNCWNMQETRKMPKKNIIENWAINDKNIFRIHKDLYFNY